jgi:hypothetical protein
MVKLKPGDRISCRLKEGTIVSPYCSDFDDIKTFDIIANDKVGYYLFIPPYLYLKEAEKVDSFLLKKLELHKKYLGDFIAYINENLVYKIISQMDGCCCARCADFSYKAAPNQEDGSFLCYLCLTDPYR